jgi:hypothetical protein
LEPRVFWCQREPNKRLTRHQLRRQIELRDFAGGFLVDQHGSLHRSFLGAGDLTRAAR